jgi:hypothetical protein
MQWSVASCRKGAAVPAADRALGARPRGRRGTSNQTRPQGKADVGRSSRMPCPEASPGTGRPTGPVPPTISAPLPNPSSSPTDLLIIDHYWLSTVRTILFRYLPSCPLNPSPFKRHACYESP